MAEAATCWVCGGQSWRPFKESTLHGLIYW
jgi:hypothetical protein